MCPALPCPALPLLLVVEEELHVDDDGHGREVLRGVDKERAAAGDMPRAGVVVHVPEHVQRELLRKHLVWNHACACMRICHDSHTHADRQTGRHADTEKKKERARTVANM